MVDSCLDWVCRCDLCIVVQNEESFKMCVYFCGCLIVFKWLWCAIDRMLNPDTNSMSEVRRCRALGWFQPNFEACCCMDWFITLIVHSWLSPDVTPSSWLGSKHQLTLFDFCHFFFSSCTTVAFGTVHNFFTCRLSMRGNCHALPWLNEFSGVVPSLFSPSR